MSVKTQRFTVVVGSGGVGKTTLAAALGLHLAERGRRHKVGEPASYGTVGARAVS